MAENQWVIEVTALLIRFPSPICNYNLSEIHLQGGPLLGGSSQDLQVVNNHGDRKPPKWGYFVYKWPNFMACK